MKRAMLGDVALSVVESENPEYSNEITSNSVELGTDIADHVRQNPISFSISGVVTGENAAEAIARLRKYRNDGTVLRYIGRNVVDNLVIEKLSTTHDNSIRNGFTFDISLKHVRIAKGQQIEIELPNPVKAPKPLTDPPKNSGYQYPYIEPPQYDTIFDYYEQQAKQMKINKLIEKAFDVERWSKSL